MFVILLVLAVLCLIALIVGFVLVLTGRGRVTRRSGDDVGREMVSELMHDEEDEAVVVAENTYFKGKAAAVEVETSISFGEIKGMVKAGQWRQAAPLLLAIGGLLGMMLFGSLAALVRAEEKVIPLVFVAMVLYALVRMGIGFAKA